MSTLCNALFGYTSLILDGDHVIPKADRGNTVAYLERGNILDAQDFPDREVHAEFSNRQAVYPLSP
jgi:hypothetical protein